ncbi:hypothetical protein A2W15_06185 [Candidatus Woesebacteria bacterium RBG_16_41_13]|nr:MAG: hypothetical protein A2W15_06185 [Candidatus Woesebacteria bacterium RBG_16_41_13]
MGTIPALTARQIIKALKKLGFREDRQKGSHFVLINPKTGRKTVIPVHAGKTIKKPLLKSIIERDVGISIEEFLEAL